MPLNDVTSTSRAKTAASETLRPFYFYVVFWGEEFRNYFLDLCLPSLLSPRNIPALGSRKGSRMLIATTEKDWKRIERSEIFHLLKRYIEPVRLDIPDPDTVESKMWLMSQGQKAAVEMAFDDGAYGIMLAPDLMLSDGSVTALERLAKAGKTLVLAPALRFAMEPIMAAFKERGWMRPGEPMVLPVRDLMTVSLPALHSEILRYEWDAPYFAEFPISVYWKVPNGSGIVLRTFSWAPMLLDYGSLEVHRTETLDDWTLDGDYIHKNFPGLSPQAEHVHVVTDSDELGFVSVTPEAELTFHPLQERWEVANKAFGEMTKGVLLDRTYRHDTFDHLKRQLFLIPLKLHGGEVSTAWDDTVKRSETIVWRYISRSALRQAMTSAESVNDAGPLNAALVVARGSGGGALLLRKPGFVYDPVGLTARFGQRVSAIVIGSTMSLGLRVLAFVRLSPRWTRRIVLAVFGDKDSRARLKRRMGEFRDYFAKLPKRWSSRPEATREARPRRRYLSVISLDEVEAVDAKLLRRAFWKVGLPARANGENRDAAANVGPVATPLERSGAKGDPTGAE